MQQVEMVGGPAGDGEGLKLPFFPDQELPPFICSGSREPFQHFAHVKDTALYLYAGECRTIPHDGCYPHSHEPC